MIDENDSIKISDLALLLTPEDGIVINADGCNGYTLTTSTSAGGSTEWIGSITAAPPPTTLTFYDEGGQAVSIDFSTGNINLAPHMTADAAARLFWDHVMAMNPLRNVSIPDNVTFECTFPAPGTGRGSLVTEFPKTPEEIALDAYTHAMKVVG
jgi:hypothetical protein